MSAVLIAEPQSDVRGFLERHLAQDGFDVVGTHDGDVALELALRAHPDLVLLGDATAVESFRGVPVIVIGGEDSDAIDRVNLDGSIQRIVDVSAHYGHAVPTAIAHHGVFYVGNLGEFDPGDQAGDEHVYQLNPNGRIRVRASGL